MENLSLKGFFGTFGLPGFPMLCEMKLVPDFIFVLICLPSDCPA